MKVQNPFPSFFGETNEKAGGAPNKILFINLIPYKYTKKEFIFYFFGFISNGIDGARTRQKPNLLLRAINKMRELTMSRHLRQS